jgi:UPF0716 protein FxsA
MRYLFFLAAVGLPISDIASLIVVGNRIGVWPTVAAIVVSGILGSILVRSQGFAIVQRARETLRSGRFPAREMFNGLCVLIGGALLLLPGFVSDVLGLLLLTPAMRGLMLRAIGNIARRSSRFEVFVAGTEGPGAAGATGPVIDGEYRPVEEAPGRLVSAPSPSERNGEHSRSPWRARPAAVVPPEDP